MQDPNFYLQVRDIISKDDRYPEEAYSFVTEAVTYTVKKITKDEKSNRHISGQELIQGICEFAVEEFGLMAETVLHEWGVLDNTAIGNIVFHLVRTKLLGATDDDSIDDFIESPDFRNHLKYPFIHHSNIQKDIPVII